MRFSDPLPLISRRHVAAKKNGRGVLEQFGYSSRDLVRMGLVVRRNRSLSPRIASMATLDPRRGERLRLDYFMDFVLPVTWVLSQKLIYGHVRETGVIFMSMPLAGGAVPQLNNAAPTDQSVLLHDQERSENATRLTASVTYL